jgi:hypothetical protein
VCSALPAAAVVALSLHAVSGAQVHACVDALQAVAHGGGDEAADTSDAAMAAAPALLDAALHFGLVASVAAVRRHSVL